EAQRTVLLQGVERPLPVDPVATAPPGAMPNLLQPAALLILARKAATDPLPVQPGLSSDDAGRPIREQMVYFHSKSKTNRTPFHENINQRKLKQPWSSPHKASPFPRPSPS